LVTLSACETALGRVDRADNLRGLPATLLAAGAEVVVGTLWPVLADARTVNLDASLKLTGIGPVPAEVGPSASRETHEEYERQAIFLEALGEGTSSAAWSFTRTPVAEIGGPFYLRLVAELPKAAHATGALSVGASIRQHAIGIFSYTANLQELPAARLLNIPDSA
jgi:CHAT domain